MHQIDKFLILSKLSKRIMVERLVTLKNFIKNSGVSFPHVLITVTWLFSTYLLYPHQSSQVAVNPKIHNKLAKNKTATTKVISQKTKKNNYAISDVIQTPTPTILQVSPTSGPTISTGNSISTITPTQAPAPTTVQENNNEQKQTVPTQASVPTTVPADNQNQQQGNRSNGALAGVSKIVNQIVPSAVTLLNSNPLISTQGH